jgi:transposase
MSEKRNSEESEPSRLEGLYRKASDPVLRTHLLMVWRIWLGDSIREVARTVGYSQKWTREIARRYESEGVEGLGDRRHGNPGAKDRALLNEEGKARLREALLEETPPGGGAWSGPKVARWIEEKIGAEKKVHVQRGWEYLREAGMRAPSFPGPPTPRGPKPPSGRLSKKAPRAAEGDRGGPSGGRSGGALWAEDEARLGLRAVLRRGYGRRWERGPQSPVQEGLRVDLPLRFRAARERRGFLADPAHAQRGAVLDGSPGVRPGSGSGQG